MGSFPLAKEDPLAVYTEWARQYGDIFYYRALHRDVYFLNHPDFIEQVLVRDFRSFRKGEALRANRRIFGNGLLTSEGEFWLRQRRLIQPCFRQERIEAYGQIMADYAARTAAQWSDGEERDIHAEMMRMTLAIAAKALFNMEISGETDRIAGPLNNLMSGSAGGRILLPPGLRLIPTRANRRYWRAVHQLDDVIFGFIRERQAHASDGGDLLSLLIQSQLEDGTQMTDRQLRDEALTLLLAGHETTAVALSWTWYLLAQHPQAEDQLQSELQSVLGGRTPGPQDIAALKYTAAVIKESLRLYPPAWALVRSAVTAFEIGGFHIPAGSNIVMSQWVTQRDPRYFEQPERFDPQRWREEQIKSIPKFAYFPFGGGSRMCIGASFAMMEAVLVLATIAQRYRIRLVPGHIVVPMPTITLRPKHGIRVVVEKLKRQVSEKPDILRAAPK